MEPLYPLILLTYLPSLIELTELVNDAVKEFIDCVKAFTEALNVFKDVKSPPADPVIEIFWPTVLIVILGPGRKSYIT